MILKKDRRKTANGAMLEQYTQKVIRAKDMSWKQFVEIPKKSRIRGLITKRKTNVSDVEMILVQRLSILLLTLLPG